MITSVERRRKWSLKEKVEIVAESLAEGAVVSEVARRYGISPQQLFGWRARLREETTAKAPAVPAAFVPAILDNARLGPVASVPNAAASPQPSSIEITRLRSCACAAQSIRACSRRCSRR